MDVLPTPALEAWKFTHLARAVEALPQAAENATQPAWPPVGAYPEAFNPQLVFVGGEPVPVQGGTQANGLPAGCVLEALGPTPCGPAEGALDGLDAMVAPQAWRLRIGQSLGQPVVVVHTPRHGQTHGAARLDIELAAGVVAEVLELHTAAPTYTGWQHHACHLALGEGATLTHSVAVLMPDAEHALATRRQRLHGAAGATYHGSLASFGGGLLRTEAHATLTENCAYNMVSLACPRLRQHHDTTTHTTHLGVGNRVNIRQRHVQADASHAVFQGKFYVAQAAQKTDAYMHCHTLLLADEARTSTKPELEIYADDVKCSHGAACGGLNPTQLFYLKARGLPQSQARALLVHAFAEAFVAQFPSPMQPLVQARLAVGLAAEGLRE